MSFVCLLENSVPSSCLLQGGFPNQLRRSTAGFYVTEGIYSFCTLTEFLWWENINKFPVQFHQFTAIQVRTKTNFFLLPSSHSSLVCIWPLLPFISDLLWSCSILGNEVSALVVAPHPSLLWRCAVINQPFAVRPSLSFRACRLLFEHVPWSLGEKGALGCPGLSQGRAGASAEKPSCNSPVGGQGQSPAVLWQERARGSKSEPVLQRAQYWSCSAHSWTVWMHVWFYSILPDICRK